MQNENRNGHSSLGPILAGITILLIAILIVLVAFRRDIKRSLYKTNTTHYSSNIETNIVNYLDNRDYSGLSSYINRNNISLDYGTELFPYAYIKFSCDCYSYLLEALMNMYLDNNYHYSEYTSNIISTHIRTIYRYVSYDSEPDGKYMQQIVDDMEVLLITYLNFTEEEIASLKDMSDAELSYFVEKKLEVLINEQ